MRTIITFSVFLLTLFSCKQKEKESKSEQTQISKISPEEMGEDRIVSQGMEFFVANTIYSRWNKLTYENESPEAHFILMDLYPEGKNTRNTKEEVLPPFDENMKLIMEGDIDNAVAAFGKLPHWFQEITYIGVTGPISPHKIATSTIYLEPGLYIMECYMKMADGTWHTSHCMYKEIIFTKESTKMEPPRYI
ncbi:hypothetical protein NYZ99_15625 [Maribacter litopenaei]|uniref:Lipoprotein n=1 Tax=Maribacter litopenaei TaxID=2976127 RepID=A0ABY5Y7X6_9FLAO|nr:hypothetical protein [Maribacter litopenaei]UWX54359.1 hypothetical protein NYZ99_15625 [Maribacter litopenaei]